MTEFYKKSKTQVLSILKTRESGLNKNEINLKSKQYGLNELKETKNINTLKIFISQFKSFIIYILIFAAIISLIAKEYIDTIVIAAIILLNAFLGLYQEFKAEKAIQALKKYSPLFTKVIRNNQLQEIDSKLLVPGDIIKLEAGNKVPADCYILSSSSLKVDESTLTGESTPADKAPSIISSSIPISDQKNMLFSSTIVTNGSALAVITSTGMSTEIGKVAYQIQTAEDKSTPLKEKLNKIGFKISIAVLIITIIVFLVGLSQGINILQILLSSIALAVAAIPEGLPLILTLTLALGTLRMIKQKALMRKLSSVETLGSTTVICSDKTGTLTKNEMTITKIFANNKLIEVSGLGYDIEGSFTCEKNKYDVKNLQRLLEAATLCNNSKLFGSKIIGDPTEGSLLVLAKKSKLNIPDYPRLNEIPFSSETKFMATINKVNNSKLMYLKGAPEIVLSNCKHLYINGALKILTIQEKKKIMDVNDSFASDALRVLGLAYSKDGTKQNLIFLGLVAMIDPPRKEVINAIKLTKKAGIRTIMITGDYKLTAKAIAEKIGLSTNCLTGKELDNIPDIKLKKIVNSVDIFARVTPEHKVRILKALKENNEIVAMTGDGINDAPALKQADIGVSVGSGTDVAKEASDMILLDDNFATIVSAIKEGRSIFSNIKKFILYLFSSNLGEVLTIFLALVFFSFFNNEMPLLIIHILWINLVTDSFPALALGLEPPENNVMDKPPKSKDSKLIKKERIFDILAIGILMGIGTLVVFKANLNNLAYAQTMAFTTLMFFQMFNVLNFKSAKSIFSTGLLNNKRLLYAILLSVALQLIIIYTPLSKIFKVVPLNLIDWLYIILISASVLIFIELRKLISKLSSKVV